MPVHTRRGKGACGGALPFCLWRPTPPPNLFHVTPATTRVADRAHAPHRLVHHPPSLTHNAAPPSHTLALPARRVSGHVG